MNLRILNLKEILGDLNPRNQEKIKRKLNKETEFVNLLFLRQLNALQIKPLLFKLITFLIVSLKGNAKCPTFLHNKCPTFAIFCN